MITTDGPVVSESNNKSMAQTETGEPEENTSFKQQMLDDGVKGRKDDKGNNGNSNRRNASKTPAYLKQVWKDDLNSGQLVISLFELFGEGIMSFILTHMLENLIPNFLNPPLSLTTRYESPSPNRFHRLHRKMHNWPAASLREN
ncbi:hypothetical protein L6452_15777 [Arctium lappa]|uniref:Uncharacterized protein n=1 Tax=Arctium lappa TaxID=4217 RepID=A0ACB9CPL5_ARCLA|nr:hypothetical protein L6452_15777 [Arctium lappa]